VPSSQRGRRGYLEQLPSCSWRAVVSQVAPRSGNLDTCVRPRPALRLPRSAWPSSSGRLTRTGTRRQSSPCAGQQHSERSTSRPWLRRRRPVPGVATEPSWPASLGDALVATPAFQPYSDTPCCHTPTWTRPPSVRGATTSKAARVESCRSSGSSRPREWTRSSDQT